MPVWIVNVDLSKASDKVEYIRYANPSVCKEYKLHMYHCSVCCVGNNKVLPMAAATGVDHLQSLFQRQLAVQEDILDAQQSMLEIQREMQSCVASLIGQDLGTQGLLRRSSGDDEGPSHVAGAGRKDGSSPLESSEDIAVERQHEVPPMLESRKRAWNVG